MKKRSVLAEQLLERIWRMIQRNQLNHYTDDASLEKLYDKKKYEEDRKAFQDLYREVHDFDPGAE